MKKIFLLSPLLFLSAIILSCSSGSEEILNNKKEKQKMYEMLAGIDGKKWKLAELHISGEELVSTQSCYSDDTFLFRKRSSRDTLYSFLKSSHVLTHQKNTLRCGETDENFIEEVSISNDLKTISISSQDWSIVTLNNDSLILTDYVGRKIKLIYPTYK